MIKRIFALLICLSLVACNLSDPNKSILYRLKAERYDRLFEEQLELLNLEFLK